MSRVVHVEVQQDLPMSREHVGAAMLRLEEWGDFAGYGPLPGVRHARFRRRTEEVVGTQIEVTNTDGSSHVEEIVEWLGTGAIAMHFSEFSQPLVFLASHFVERWRFEPSDSDRDGCRVTRTFDLYARSWWSAWVLRLVGVLMRRALTRHLQYMAAAAGAQPAG